VVLIAICNPASISTLYCKKTVYFGVKTEKIITRKWAEVLGEVAKNQSNSGGYSKKKKGKRVCSGRWRKGRGCSPCMSHNIKPLDI
jgi:hypothetical protein